MVIKSEKEYKDYEVRAEKLMQRGTELGDMELLTDEEKAEFMQLSEALDEYGSAYHPLPGQMSSLLTDAILLQVKEKGLKQKDTARMIRYQPHHVQRPYSWSSFVELRGSSQHT